MRKEDYLNILKTRLHNFLDKSAYPEGEITFQQDGDIKHTAKIVKEWLAKQNFKFKIPTSIQLKTYGQL